MLNQAEALKETLIHLRRTIHQHPELGFEEFQTSALVARTLADLGIEVQTGVGKTGVIARLGNGDGPARFHHHLEFDIDENALPIGSAVLAETALRFIKGDYAL